MVENWLIMGYFVILFAERFQSIVRSVTDPQVSVMGDGFNRYVYLLCSLSLVAFVVLLFVINRDFLKSLFKSGTAVDYKMLSITIGVILLSGMVHTEHTIPAIQFGSYGLLIAALVIFTARNNASSENRVLMWMSLVYLIFFSMAIPVVYRSEIKLATAFHVIEAVVSVVLVAAFAYMSYKVFTGQAVNLFSLVPIIVAVAGDVLILAMRWHEKVNSFVLIFLIASVIMWVAGVIVRSAKG